MADEAKQVAKITIDRGLCIGAGSCISSVQGVYELDEENKAVMLLKGGIKTSDATDKGKLEKHDLKWMQVWAVKDNKAYIISYTAEVNKYSYFFGIIQEMISSFEII